MTPPSAAPVHAAGPPVVTLSGAQGIVAAVPQYLGFVPDQSLVLMCLTRPRGRIGPVARIDLPPPGCAEVLLPVLDCVGRHADAAAVICYHSGDRPVCIDDVTGALRARRIPIVATLSVSAGRIRDARSPSSMRRDPGLPHLSPDDRQAVALRSAAILAGRLPLPSRGALAASIAPPGGWDDTTIARHIDAGLRDLAPAFDAAGALLTPDLVRRVDAALAAAEAEYRSTGRVAADTAARAIAVAQHAGCRDLIIARGVGRADTVMVGLAAAVAAQCPDAYCAQWCVALAAVAYRSGDGALAHCALDRVTSVEPRHRMARLLRSLIALCPPPDALDVLTRIQVPDGAGVSRAAGEGDRSRS